MYNQYNNFRQCYFVNSFKEAKEFQMGTNQDIMMMNINDPIVYLKTTDGMGISSIKCFKLEEFQPDDELTTGVSKSDFEAFKREILELLGGKKNE